MDSKGPRKGKYVTIALHAENQIVFFFVVGNLFWTVFIPFELILLSFSYLIGIKQTITGSFAEVSWKEKTVAFGADGASVNLGKKAGVAALMRQDIPHLLDFHCLPHRLELSILEMQRSCKSVAEVYNVLDLVWKTYHYSPKSTRDLQALAVGFDINVRKPTRVGGTRWLPHVSRALKVFIKAGSDNASKGQYAAVACHMDHLSATSRSSDIKGRARFVASRMRDIQFVAFCHFLSDMFAILERLSLMMQRDDVILPSVVSQLAETVTSITCLKTRPAPNGYLEHFLKDDSKTYQGLSLTGSLEGKTGRAGNHSPSLNSEVTKAVDLCLGGLNERFESLMDATGSASSSGRKDYGSADVIHDLLVFNTNSWPTNNESLLDFGKEQIERLVTWFEPALHAADCNVSEVHAQWVSLKMIVSTQFRDKDYVTLWETLLTKAPYKNDLKDVLHLVEILLVLPISAAGCERAVSAQNRIKSSVRVSLNTSTLDGLIRNFCRRTIS